MMDLATAIVLVGAASELQPFTTNNKMPGPSYDLPARACRRGSILASDPKSMCNDRTYYAKRGFFRWSHVRAAAERRLMSIVNPRWVEAFAYILHTKYRSTTHFRWHASGDLQSIAHFQKIVQVAREVRHMRFWLPTHEPYLLAEALMHPDTGRLPDNLTVRISADRVGERPRWEDWPLNVRRLPTSMVHYTYGDPPKISGHKVFECRAHDRDNSCGPCRACWKPALEVVTYPKTDIRGVSANRRLPIFQETV